MQQKSLIYQGVFSSHDQMIFLRESFILMKFDHPALSNFMVLISIHLIIQIILIIQFSLNIMLTVHLKKFLTKKKKQHCKCQLESHEKVYLFTWNYRCNAISAQGRHYSPRSKATKHSC